MTRRRPGPDQGSDPRTSERGPSAIDYRSLAERAPAILYRYRVLPSPQMEYVNAAVTQTLGYTPEDFYADPNTGPTSGGTIVHLHGLGTAWTFISDDADEAERVLRDVVAALVRRPPEELRGSILVGTREHCRDLLRAYRDAGVQRLLIWPVRDDLQQLEVFMEIAEGV